MKWYNTLPKIWSPNLPKHTSSEFMSQILMPREVSFMNLACTEDKLLDIPTLRNFYTIRESQSKTPNIWAMDEFLQYLVGGAFQLSVTENGIYNQCWMGIKTAPDPPIRVFLKIHNHSSPKKSKYLILIHRQWFSKKIKIPSSDT